MLRGSATPTPEHLSLPPAAGRTPCRVERLGHTVRCEGPEHSNETGFEPDDAWSTQRLSVDTASAVQPRLFSLRRNEVT